MAHDPLDNMNPESAEHQPGADLEAPETAKHAKETDNLKTTPSSDKKDDAATDEISEGTQLAKLFHDMLEDRGDDVYPAFRFKHQYRGLVSRLTVRQLKSYMRGCLYGPVQNGRETAEKSLLNEIFHPFWRVMMDEPKIFRLIQNIAKSIVYGIDPEYGPIAAGDTKIYFNQIITACSDSSHLTQETLHNYWPRQENERALLIWLIACVNLGEATSQTSSGTRTSDQQQPSSGARISDSQPSSSEKSAQPSPGSQDGTEQTDDSTHTDPSTTLPDFSEWARSCLHTSIQGFSVAEQVSSFQDIVSAHIKAGREEAKQCVAQYATLYLKHHTPFFEPKTAASLSNLATTIDDDIGYEGVCDELFRAAVALDGNARVPMHYAQFLIGVAQNKNRLDQLRTTGLYGETGEAKDKVIEKIDSLLAVEEGGPITDLMFLSKILQATSQNTLAETPLNETQRLSLVWSFCRQHASFLADAAEQNRSEPFGRLSKFLDDMAGSGADRLPVKEPLLGAFFGMLKRLGLPTWTVSLYMANDFVGESNRKSPDEALGLRMNVALLCDPIFLHHADLDRIAGIWTQSGSVLMHVMNLLDKGKTKGTHRVAMTFLIAKRYGEGQAWHKRWARAWHAIGSKESLAVEKPAEPKAFLEYKEDTEALALYQQLDDEPHNADIVRKVAECIFLPPYWPPLESLDTLSEATKWGEQRFEWARDGQEEPERDVEGNYLRSVYGTSKKGADKPDAPTFDDLVDQLVQKYRDSKPQN